MNDQPRKPWPFIKDGAKHYADGRGPLEFTGYFVVQLCPSERLNSKYPLWNKFESRESALQFMAKLAAEGFTFEYREAS